MFRELFPADDAWGLGAGEEEEVARAWKRKGLLSQAKEYLGFILKAMGTHSKASSSGGKCSDLYFRKTTEGSWKHKENGLGDKTKKKKRPVRKLLVKSN